MEPPIETTVDWIEEKSRDLPLSEPTPDRLSSRVCENSVSGIVPESSL